MTLVIYIHLVFYMLAKLDLSCFYIITILVIVESVMV